MAKKPSAPKKPSTAKKPGAAKKLGAAKKPGKPKPKAALPPSDAAANNVLDRLWDVVQARRDADPAVSHSARLLSRGTAKVAQKFGEEAVECLIEAVAGNPPGVVSESADVLYHLLVLWVDAGVTPAAVWAELERREGVSGIAEKAARPAPLARSAGTRKIP